MSVQPRTARRAEWSQHFLRKGALGTRLVEATSVSARDLVVEIGAGRGALTRPLARRSRRLIAVEIDPVLCDALRGDFADEPGVEVVEADFLDVGLPRESWKAIGSLPYARTTEIVRRLDAAPSPPEDAWLVVQLEAARRFAGAPWGPESRLSLLLKPRWQVEIVQRLVRGDFDPPPSVDSALLWLARRARPLVPPGQAERYLAFVTASFGGRGARVQDGLRATLTSRQIERLARELRFDRRAPPSSLSFDQWLALFRFVAQTSVSTGKRVSRSGGR